MLFFYYNTAYYAGGGVYVPGNYSSMTDCIVSNNSTKDAGGGVYLAGGNSSATLKNSTIVNNRTTVAGVSGGGVYMNGLAIVSNCVIAGNYQRGVFMDFLAAYADSIPQLVNCQIYNNTVNYGVGISPGAGVYNESIYGFIRNCYIHHNTNWGKLGGGGIYVTNGSVNYLTGGVFNCTIVNNWSTNEGGGISIHGPSNYIVNCIVADNVSVSGNYPNVYIGNNTLANSSNIYYSCVVTAAANVLAANQGNITNDPLFKTTRAGNNRLKSNSPCVNTGSNQNWMTSFFDLDGKIRKRYGRVDMGAFEAIIGATVYKFH